MTDPAALQAMMTDWRRHLHRNPEFGFEETATAAFVADRLRDIGIEVATGIGGTGVVGSHISPIASIGPMKAPAVSSDCRSPKAAPRRSGGAISATSASRGAPRMPLPTRSMKRAATSQPTVGASGKTGLVTAASP